MSTWAAKQPSLPIKAMHSLAESTNGLERLLIMVTSLCLLAGLQLLINVPSQDIPDMKDIPFLYPQAESDITVHTFPN